jgi:hypothetical protein
MQNRMDTRQQKGGAKRFADAVADAAGHPLEHLPSAIVGCHKNDGRTDCFQQVGHRFEADKILQDGVEEDQIRPLCSPGIQRPWPRAGKCHSISMPPQSMSEKLGDVAVWISNQHLRWLVEVIRKTVLHRLRSAGDLPGCSLPGTGYGPRVVHSIGSEPDSRRGIARRDAAATIRPLLAR